MHPGYPYDECTAIYARLYAWLGAWVPATRLGHVMEGLIAKNGLLGRDETHYVFDTSIALDSLADPIPVHGRLMQHLLMGRACDPIDRPGWWSQSFGAHQIKALAFLARHGRAKLCRSLVDGLVDDCFDGQRFTIHADSPMTYLHSHCYALEGLMMLDAHPTVLEAGLGWLAEVMEPDGALPAWFEGPLTDYRQPGDVVAQAVRLWAAVDPRRWASDIERGVARLGVLQHPNGLIRYGTHGEDCNTWVSAFALQALRWVDKPPNARELAWLL